MRANEICQLLAVALSILASLAFDGSQLLLEPTQFAVFRVVVLLGLCFRIFEVSQAFVDLGTSTVCVLDVRFPLLFEVHQAMIARSAYGWQSCLR